MFHTKLNPHKPLCLNKHFNREAFIRGRSTGAAHSTLFHTPLARAEWTAVSILEFTYALSTAVLYSFAVNVKAIQY